MRKLRFVDCRRAGLVGLLVWPALALGQSQAYTNAPAELFAGPGTNYPVVAGVPGGEPVEVMGCLSTYDWCDVALSDLRGWMYAGYLSYPYEGSRVPILTYGAVIGFPIVVFSFDSYWGHHYRDRPWYHDRDRWRHEVPHRSPPPGYHPGPRPQPPQRIEPRHPAEPPGARPPAVAPRPEGAAPRAPAPAPMHPMYRHPEPGGAPVEPRTPAPRAEPSRPIAPRAAPERPEAAPVPHAAPMPHVAPQPRMAPEPRMAPAPRPEPAPGMGRSFAPQARPAEPARGPRGPVERRPEQEQPQNNH